MAKLTHQTAPTPWSKPTTHRTERTLDCARTPSPVAAGAPRRVDANSRHGSQSRGHWTPMRLEAAPRPRQSQCSGSVSILGASQITPKTPAAPKACRHARVSALRVLPALHSDPAVESTSMRARAPAPALPLQGSVWAQHGIMRSGSRKCTCWSWALRPSRRRLRPGTASMAA